jgi:hypothetical protein
VTTIKIETPTLLTSYEGLADAINVTEQYLDSLYSNAMTLENTKEISFYTERLMLLTSWQWNTQPQET